MGGGDEKKQNKETWKKRRMTIRAKMRTRKEREIKKNIKLEYDRLDNVMRTKDADSGNPWKTEQEGGGWKEYKGNKDSRKETRKKRRSRREEEEGRPEGMWGQDKGRKEE